VAGLASAGVPPAQPPTPMAFVGVQDRFGQSGPPQRLVEEYGMGVTAIVAAVRRPLKRKGQ